MQFCFIANGDVLTLPITPASYEWTTGKNMETINISELGDVYLPGGRSRHSGSIDCLLPFRDYYEVTKNVTFTQHAFVYIVLCMSDDAWNKIPEDLREPFLAAVQEGVEYERSVSV